EAGLAIKAREARSVADKAACIRKLAYYVGCGNAKVCRQRGKASALAGEEGIAAEHQRADPLFDQLCKGGVDFIFGAGIQNKNLNAERSCSLLYVFSLVLAVGVFRIEQDRDCGGGRHGVVREGEPLFSEPGTPQGHARHVTSP